MESIARVEELRSELRFVKVPDRTVDLSRFPDYLVLGPQRTGTTWLGENLTLHPQIFFSNPKSPGFFNLLTLPDHRRYITNDLSWYLQLFKDTPWSYTRKMVYSLSRFREPYRPLVRGEATASYAAMRRELIEEVITIKPDIKAIMMIRNPIDRAWSHARKDLLQRSKRRAVEEIPDEEFAKFFVNPHQVRCGSYSDMIDTWSSMLRPGHLFVGLFDDVRLRPAEFLESVFSFLGVSKDNKYVTQRARARINATTKGDMPPQHRTKLQELFAEELQRLERERGLSWD